MSSTQLNKILDVYKKLYRIPSITSAKIIPAVKNEIKVQSVWSERNLERRTKQTFFQEFSLNADKSFPIDISTELLSATSDDENLKAVLRDVTVDGKSKQFIEIWDNQHVSKSYDISALDLHGDIYVEPTFSAFSWSPDNRKLLYVAEKKLPKSEPFYKQKPKPKTDKPTEEEEEPTKGTEYVYKPDWGEQLVGKHKSVVVILNVEDDSIVPISTIPEDYFPAQVIWAPNGEDIIGVAYKLKTRYLGLYACTNRESYIFHLKGTEFRKLTAEGRHCISPRLSPDGKHLIWLERNLSSAHHNVQRLMHLKWESSENPEILIDLVKKEVEIANNKKFYGLYNQSLPKRCWSDDSNYAFLSTPQRSNIRSYIVNLETKVITEIDNKDSSSLVVADVKQNYVAFIKHSLISPHQLVIGKFEPEAKNIGDITIHELSKPMEAVDKDIMYEHTEFVYDNEEPVKDFNFTYLGKKNGPNQSVPLIAVGHGGPHVSYCNMFHVDYALYATLGFGILQINYRGSTGLGGDNVDYLLGKVGEVDVIDCMTAINLSLEKYPWIDPKKVNAYGGSHGGFLAAHLSGQYPDKFKSVILLNAVVDIASMFTITDIPDWCRTECGYSFLEELPLESNENYNDITAKMLKHSPIIYVDRVKAPTLIAIGSKDLRVPASQGKAWYYRLTANNVKTKLLMYEDNHSLRKDEVEIDHVINTALWLLEHNDKKLIRN